MTGAAPRPLGPTELLAVLKQQAGGAASPETVQQLETHGAWVFLIGNDVWKVKRPVKYPYMNFSTPELRHAACARELEINRLTAPQVYLGLDAITREADGNLALNGTGAIIDWAVHMRRFDQTNLLDRLAERGQLPAGLMQKLAAVIHEFHDNAPQHRGKDSAGAAERLITLNDQAFTEMPDVFPAMDAKALAMTSRTLLEHVRPLLGRRQRAGLVRRCHGDLHLRNIVVLDGTPTLFDALEFDEQIATVDVLDDLAFLLMDLVHRGLHLHANIVLNHYMAREEPGRLQGIAALPLFMSLRAAIRAKVAAALVPIADSEQTRQQARQDARDYFELAGQLLNWPAPRMIAIGGLSGTGKSTLGRHLAPELGWPLGALHLRSDIERKIMSGVPETARLPKQAYTPEASQKVYQRLRTKAEIALGAGISVIVDAVHAHPDERLAIEAIAEKAGISFDGLWLVADAGTMIDRVTRRHGDASDADADVVQTQLGYDIDQIVWHRINAVVDPEEMASTAIRALDIDRSRVARMPRKLPPPTNS